MKELKDLHLMESIILTLLALVLATSCSEENVSYDCECFDTIWKYSELFETEIPDEVSEFYSATCGGDELTNGETILPDGRRKVTQCN